MNVNELLVIAVVAIIVFGPGKLPMLAEHLGKVMRLVNQLRQQAQDFWQSQLKQQQLLENKHKAAKADAIYQNQQEEK